MFFALLFLLGLEFAVELEVNKVWSEIVLGDGLVGFEEGDIFSVGLFGDFPLFFLFHVDLFGV